MKYNSINLVRVNLILMGLYLQGVIFSFSNYSLNPIFKILSLRFPTIFLFVYFGINILKGNVWKGKNKQLFIVTIIYFLFYDYLLVDAFFHQNIIGKLPQIISFFCIISLSRKQKAKSYIFIYKTISLLLLFSLIGYFLFKFNFNVSFKEIETNHLLKLKAGISYLKSYFYVIIKQRGLIQSNRFYGFFDEPGTLGTIVGMIFLFDNNYKILKKERVILFISGLLTLSMAFYIFIFFKYLSFPLNFIRKISVAFLLSMVLILGKVYLEKNHNNIYKQTYVRILNKEDNRTSNEAKVILKKFYRTNDIFLGTGRIIDKDYTKIDISSWNNIVYQKGFVGLVIILSYMLYIAEFFKRDKFTKLSIIFFITSIYQRPNILTVLNLYILLCGLEYSSFVYKKNRGANNEKMLNFRRL